MLLLSVCLFLISKASVDNYAVFVADVWDTFKECSIMVQDFGRYLRAVGSLDDVRRRAEEAHGIGDEKLGACFSILDAADSYRINHKRYLVIENDFRWADNQLNELLSDVSKRMGEVLYVASVDGDDVSQFHRACDGKGSTIVVVKSINGSVFGGYTDVEWASEGAWKNSQTSFVFRLLPTFKKYDIKRDMVSKAVYHGVQYGPIFGYGNSIRIENNSLSNENSRTQGSYSYKIPSAQKHELNDGEEYFRVSDYFVVEAIDL